MVEVSITNVRTGTNSIEFSVEVADATNEGTLSVSIITAEGSPVEVETVEQQTTLTPSDGVTSLPFQAEFDIPEGEVALVSLGARFANDSGSDTAFGRDVTVPGPGSGGGGSPGTGGGFDTATIALLGVGAVGAAFAARRVFGDGN
jgi:hypothetical protein